MQHWVNRAGKVLRGQGLASLLVRSVAGTGAVRIASMGASFLVGVQLARMLGVSGYGYYGLALSVITLCGIPGEMGLPRLVTREVAAARARKDLPHLFGVIRWADRWAMRISAVVGVALCIAAFLVDRLTGSPVAWALVIGAPVVPLMALSRLRGGALQGLHQIVRGQIPANLLRPFVQSALLILAYAAAVHLNPAKAMAINLAGAAAAFLLSAYWVARSLPAKTPAEVVHGGRQWLASTIPMAAADGMRILQSELSILLLGVISAPAEVGLFRVAAATASAAATPITIINHVAFPVIARLHAEKDVERLQIAVKRLAQAQFAGVLLLCLPLLVASEWLLRLVFGDAFSAAANATRIYALAQVVNAAFGPNVALLNMSNQERRVTRAMAVALVVNIVAVVALGPTLGGTGASIAIFVGLLAWNVLTWIDGRRRLGIDSSMFASTDAGSQ